MKSLYKTRMLYSILVLFFLASISSFGQTRREKTVEIIEKLGLVEAHSSFYKSQLKLLKNQASGQDSIRIVELQEQLSEEKVLEKVTGAFKEIFNNEEINDIYEFMQTSAFEKLFDSGELNRAVTDSLEYIYDVFKKIKKNIGDSHEKPADEFEPVPVDRKNGFYLTTNYSESISDEDIELEENPSLTFDDVLDVKKDHDRFNDNRPIIVMTLTKEGARKFYRLTKSNILKPIAIVIDKHIVYMPIVQDAVIGGKLQITGEFTDEEIDKMINQLRD